MAWLLPAVLLLVCASAAAQMTSGVVGQFGMPNATNDTATYKLTGQVVNAVSGEPIARALVQVQQNAMLTDGSGGFEFSGLQRSTAFVMARKPGYFNEQEMASAVGGGMAVSRSMSAARSSLVQVGPDTTPVTVKLYPAALLTGRITNAEGEGLENVQVRLFIPVINNGRRRWQQTQGGSTDEDGRFKIGNLKPGAYMVAAMGTRYNEMETPNAQQTKGYPLQWFFPGVAERSGAGTVELASGQSLQMDLVVPLQPVYRIGGVMNRPPAAGPNGQMMGMGVQLMTPEGEMIGAQLHLLPNNRYELWQVPAGQYIVHSNTRDNEGHTYTADVPVNVVGNMDNVNVTLGASTSIPVHVKSELTKQQTQTQVRSGPQPGQWSGYRAPPVQVQLESVDPPYQTSYAQQEGGANPTGDALFRDVRPGKYMLRFPGQGMGTYVQSATCGTVDLLRAPLVVPAGGQLPAIELIVRDDGGTISVKANGDVPDNGAQILVFSDAMPAQTPRSAFLPGTAMLRQATAFGAPPNFVQSMAAQAAQIQGLAPGEYTVLAFDRMEGLEYANPEVLRKYLARAGHVSVAANGSATINVDVIKVEE